MLRLKKDCLKKMLPIFASIIILNFIMATVCYAKDVNYKIKTESDGGYSLEIHINETILFSADGFFTITICVMKYV